MYEYHAFQTAEDVEHFREMFSGNGWEELS